MFDVLKDELDQLVKLKDEFVDLDKLMNEFDEFVRLKNKFYKMDELMDESDELVMLKSEFDELDKLKQLGELKDEFGQLDELINIKDQNCKLGFFKLKKKFYKIDGLMDESDELDMLKNEFDELDKLKRKFNKLDELIDKSNKLRIIYVRRVGKKLNLKLNELAIALAEQRKKTPKAPDGGWGWMVVFAFFCISVISDGIRYSFGVMFLSLLEAFGRNKGETAWVGGLLAGTSNIVGPLVTKMTDRFGCRTVAITGSFMASLGIFTSVFAQKLYQLYITLGVMTGMGYGMIYLTSVVSISRYFDKRRSLAMGISMCGSGIGSIIFNPLSKWLIDEYGWRGTLLIEAGLVLNCVAFSALYRPLADSFARSGKEKVPENDILLKENDTKDVSSANDTRVYKLENSETENLSVCNSQRNSLFMQLLTSDRDLKHEYEESSETKDHQMYATDLQCYHEGDTSFGAHDENRKLDKPSKLRQNMNSAIGLFRFSLLKDPSFLVYFTSGFLIALSYNVPYIYVPDLATELGYTKSMAVLLISYLGIANTLGRVVFGILGDKPWVKRSHVFSINNIIGGIFTAFVPLLTLYGLLVMYVVVYGMTSGGHVALSTLVAGDLFTVEVITESVGLYMFACGIANFIGVPLAGWLFDVTKTYDLSFIWTGIMLVLAGTILFLIHFIRRKKRKT